MRVAITGVGKALPERIVTNQELALRLGITEEWIVTRTGIRQRHWASEQDSSASLGARAAQEALAGAGLDPAEVSMVIVATCTPDYILPATANLIQNAIGASRAGSFDVAAACSGFVYSLSLGASLVGSAAANKVLVVGVDLLSRHINLEDPLSAPLFGDGAAAVVLEGDESAEPMRFELGSDGAGAEQVIIPGGGSKLGEGGLPHDPSCLLLKMSGREVFRSAVRVMSELGTRFGKDSFDLMIAHQANKRIIDECAVQIGIPPEKAYLNIDRYGNTSAASIPLAIYDAWTEGLLVPGSRLLMVAFGAGYTWGAAALNWTMPTPARPTPGDPAQLTGVVA
ncbi:MAG: 3-oxoacyl-ACP synthase III family protein [Actinomycetota bacterium]